jgi:hypothetical protein
MMSVLVGVAKCLPLRFVTFTFNDAIISFTKVPVEDRHCEKGCERGVGEIKVLK